MKYIRDGKGKLVGQIIDNVKVVYIRDGQGKLKGQYLKTADKTLDGKGHYVGSGDQLLRTLDQHKT